MQTQPAAAERSPQKCAIWDGRQVRHSRWRQQIYHRCRAKSIKEKLGTSCVHNLSGRNEFTASWSLGLDSVWTVVQNKTVYNDQGAKKPEQQIFGAASYSQGICLSWCLIMHCTCIDVHRWKFLCLNATLCSRPIRPLIVLLKTSCSGALQQTTGLLQMAEPYPSGLSRSRSLQVAVPTTCHLVETRCQESDTHLMATMTLAQTNEWISVWKRW